MRQKWPYNTILSPYSSIRYVLNNVQIKRCLGNKGECFKWQSYHTRHYLHSKIHFHNICVMFSLCASIEFGVTKNISCVLLTLPNKALPLIYKATLHWKWSWYFLEYTLHCSLVKLFVIWPPWYIKHSPYFPPQHSISTWHSLEHILYCSL